eukprot:g3891.t1
MGAGSSAKRAEEQDQNGGFHGASPGSNQNFERGDDNIGSYSSNTPMNGNHTHDNDWDADTDTTTWAFELIPFYDKNDYETVENLEQVVAGIHIDSRDDFGNTMLMMAVHHNKIDLVKWAIRQGADVNAINFAGVCALHICCHESSVSHDMVATLLEAGASTEIADANGCTVLHYAASAGDAELVQQLLRFDARVAATDNQGFSAIEYAFESQDERCTSMLLDAEERQRRSTNDRSGGLPEARVVDVAQEGDWVEYVDHMSGHAYYHNTKTKETRWDRPHGFGMTMAGATQEISGHSINKRDKKAKKLKKDKKSKKDKKDKKLKKDKKEKKKKKKKAREKEKEKNKTDDKTDGAEEEGDGDNNDSTSGNKVNAENTSDASEENSSDDSGDDDVLTTMHNRESTKGKSPEDIKSYRIKRNMQIWNRLAWKEGIKRVAQRRRREALKAAREHMILQQQETMKRMEEEHAARMEELKQKTAEEVEKKLQELQSKQQRELEESQKSTEANSELERKRLEQIAAKHKAEADQWKKNHAKEQKEREKIAKKSIAIEKAYKIANERAKKEYNEKMNLLGNIRVFARIRPMLSFEKDKGCVSIISTQQYDKFDSISVNNIEKGREKTFRFDRVYNSDVSQSEVYEGAEPLLQSALDGLNVCIFAYGQTGSGKTYTMNGALNSENPEAKGLMPRTFDLIFEKINNQKLMEVEVRMFVLELYVDKLIDLFDASRDGNGERIVIRKNKFGTVMPTGVNVRIAKTAQDLYNYLDEATQRRKVSSTKMNSESSRSHLIVSIVLKLKDKQSGDESEGKITLVDLAGCERVKKSGAEAQALKEAQSINTSLSALGNVVSAVLAGQKHIPYRSNILTLLMSDTVGGNAKAQMFVNISPADYNAEETENSLTFAQRVKQVKNQSRAERDAEAMKIKLQKQVLELQKKLAGKG